MVAMKRLVKPSFGENVGHLHNASEIVKWHIHSVKQFDTFLKKVKIHLYNPTIPYLSNYTR